MYEIVCDGLLLLVRVSRVTNSSALSAKKYHKLLAAELRDAPMRYNTACLHYQVEFPTKQKLSPDNNTLEYGAVFPALLADTNVRSELICFTDPAMTSAWVADHKRHEQ